MLKTENLSVINHQKFTTTIIGLTQTLLQNDAMKEKQLTWKTSSVVNKINANVMRFN